ncbi:MAG: aminotransferase class V-fold PLP-dependent enzyme [Patescibacteria group bacterium]|nr:aminotransferase class V-fold PLP-dependent enzyme [Patescibacteria group bacterium]
MLPSNIRNRFPIFAKIPGLVYLDSAATSLKVQEVLDAEMTYYTEYSANVHRGIYRLAEQATAAYEDARHAVAELISASSHEEIVITSGTTGGINLVANALVPKIRMSERIVTTIMEHHSNFVPWQQAAKRAQCEFAVIPVRVDGFLDVFSADGTAVDEGKLSEYVTTRTRVFAVTALSNTLGTLQPIRQLVKAIKRIAPNCTVVVDAAQAVPFTGINVQQLGADFVAFSAHKIFGPTGVGVLWGDRYALDLLPPSQFGGEMVAHVAVEETTYKKPPLKFEAGTPNIAGAIGMAVAARFLGEFSAHDIRKHESELVSYCIDGLRDAFANEITIMGTPDVAKRAGLVSFFFRNAHAHDVAQILDEDHICVRAGHHCAMPLHNRFSIPASVRASFSIYNTREDVDRLLAGLRKVREVL